MNFALSQRRSDRHPVGLAIVVGLHVLLAGALLSARLAAGPSTPPEITLTPVDAPSPPPRVVRDPLVPPVAQPRMLVAEVPPIAVEHTDVIVAPVDEPARRADVVVAAAGPGDDVVHEPARLAPRRAVLDAGAAQCRPLYPPAAQRAGVTGISRIRFTVDASGRVAGAQILQSSGPTRENRLLDKAAADALAQCPVTAGTDERGRPVGGSADVEYVWTLN